VELREKVPGVDGAYALPSTNGVQAFGLPTDLADVAALVSIPPGNEMIGELSPSLTRD